MPPKPATIDPNVILPPSWAFGVIYGGYTDQATTIAKVQRLIDENYPIDAYWIDSCFWDITTKGPKGYIDFKGNTRAYPDTHCMWETLHSQCVKSGIWVWDRMLREGNEAIFDKFEKQGFFRDVRVFTETWHNKSGQSVGGWLDYDNPAAVALWKASMKPLFDQGLDFLKLDAAAALPYVRANFELTAEAARHTRGRGFVISHEVFPRDTQEFKRYPAVWSGDSIPHWKHDEYPDTVRHLYGGLSENIDMVANPDHPNYDFPFLTNDTGGFSSRFGEPTDELFMRWTQFSAFGTIMEVFGSLFFEAQNAPYTFSAAAQENFRFYTHLRMKLFPYIYSYAHRTRATGMKMIRGTREHPRQFLFGEEFLVAPVHAGRVKTMSVFLPEGTWIDYWTHQVHSGKQTIQCETPVDRMPLFVKSGAIIPMRNYARAVELGSNDPLTLDIYPDNVSSFTLSEDDGLSNDYLNGKITETTFTCRQEQTGIMVEIGAARGNYDGRPSQRTVIMKINGTGAPRTVRIASEYLPGCSGPEMFDLTDQGYFFDARENVNWIRCRVSTTNNVAVVLQ